MQVGLCYMTPLPGTDIYEHPQEYGITLLDPMLETSFAFDNCVTKTDSMERADIMRARARLWKGVSKAMTEACLSAGEKLRESADRLGKEIGLSHLSQEILSSGSLDGFQDRFRDIIRHNAEEHSAFSCGLSSAAAPIIPVRLLSLAGAWELDLDEQIERGTVSGFERQVLDHSAGKLSVDDIAHRLSVGTDAVMEALSRLENLGLLIYRSF
jgi:hypothetical protein